MFSFEVSISSFLYFNLKAMQQHYFSQNGTHFVSDLKVNNQAINVRTIVQNDRIRLQHFSSCL